MPGFVFSSYQAVRDLIIQNHLAADLKSAFPPLLASSPTISRRKKLRLATKPKATPYVCPSRVSQSIASRDCEDPAAITELKLKTFLPPVPPRAGLPDLRPLSADGYTVHITSTPKYEMSQRDYLLVENHIKKGRAPSGLPVFVTENDHNMRYVYRVAD